MKKWIIGSVAFLFVAWGSVYFFIPSTLIVSAVTPVNSTFNSAIAFSANSNNWYKWFPNNTPQKGSSCNNCIAIYKDVQYQIVSKSYNNTQLRLVYKNDTTIVSLAVASFLKDSIKIVNQFMFKGSLNPIKRIQQYNEAVYLKQNIHEVMTGLKKFLEKPENIYGFKVVSTMVKDTVLMSTKSEFKHYPTTKEIYVLVNELRSYIKLNNGIETNAPMVNVTKESDNTFKTMVAIPVNHSLPATNKITLKKMVIGRILESETIHGGTMAVDTAYKAFQQYFIDFKHASPAIPFQLLVSDRIKETDSSKWLTKFYYPIF